MALPARTRLALAFALLLALGAAWLALPRAQRDTPRIPETAATPAPDLRHEEPLEAAPSKAEPPKERTVASPAHASTEDPRSLERQLRPRAQPTRPAAPDPGLPCTLVVHVLDADGRPVTSLQFVQLRWGDAPQPFRVLSDLESKDGEFACAIADAAGTVEVRSLSLGTAQAAYAHPSGGTSRVELRLGFLALIQGRVVHEGSGIEGALVTLMVENGPLPDPLTRIAVREPVPRCRGTRAQVASGTDGRFQIAVNERWHYRLCAREPAHGACISSSFEITNPPEPVVCELELAPASHLEVRSLAIRPEHAAPFVNLMGDNGLNTSARIDERDGIAAFDCLPQGSYIVLRALQGLYEDEDPPAHLELDGAPGTVARLELREPGAIALEIVRDDTQGRIDAELYRLGCCAQLVSRGQSQMGNLAVNAADPGEHLLAVFSSARLGTRCTRVFRVELAIGTNHLALRPVALDGNLIVGTDSFDLPRHLLARFELDGGGQLFILLRSNNAAAKTNGLGTKFAESSAVPTGTCDLVHEREGQFEVLQSGVHVAGGAPTIVRLSAGSAARR